MRAMDVMTTGVITVDPDTSVQAIATLLSERGISGVPVVDAADRLLGIVSEGDLLHRVETGTERLTRRRRSWWLDTIASDQELARDYVKSHGRTAKDVMTREVISVTDTTDLAEVAMLLETKRIKRVPVLHEGKLVGIVSRANLVRALAVTKSDSAVDAATDDRTIRAELLAELMTTGMVQDPGLVQDLGSGRNCQGSSSAFLGRRQPDGRRETGVARRRREHRRCTAGRGAHHPVALDSHHAPQPFTSQRRQVGGDLTGLHRGQIFRIFDVGDRSMKDWTPKLARSSRDRPRTRSVPYPRQRSRPGWSAGPFASGAFQVASLRSRAHVSPEMRSL